MKKEGLNIICSAPIPFFKAVLGCTLEIPTLEGKRKVKVPPGIRSGRQIKLRGRGIPSQNDKKKRGDLIVRLQVENPKRLTREDRKILRALEKNSKQESYPLTLKYKKKMEGY